MKLFFPYLLMAAIAIGDSFDDSDITPPGFLLPEKSFEFNLDCASWDNYKCEQAKYQN